MERALVLNTANVLGPACELARSDTFHFSSTFLNLVIEKVGELSGAKCLEPDPQTVSTGICR